MAAAGTVYLVSSNPDLILRWPGIVEIHATHLA
jgi:hypothetical protein